MKIILFLLLLTACVTPTPDMGVPAQYPAELKPQLPFTVEGIQYQGTASVQRQTVSTIKFIIPEKTELIVVSSCARQEEYWKPQGKEFVYKFNPAIYLENSGSCLLSFIVVTAIGEFNRILIDYSNVQSNPLPLDVACNGVWKESDLGADICSIREGLPVRLWPKEKTVIAKDPLSDCEEPKRDGLMYEITAKKGFCVYYVMTKTKEFRFTLYGYSSFLGVFPPENKK